MQNTDTARKPRATISLVQLYVRRDEMMHGKRSIRSFDTSLGLLSREDLARYYAQA